MASLSVAEFREHVTTSLGDDAIELLLDAAWQAIAIVAGEEGDVVEVRDGGGSYVFLSRRATSVDSVKEWLGYSYEQTLDAADYRLLSDGLSLRRLNSGTTPATYWAGPVEITATAVDDDALRQSLQLQLVSLFLNHHPGITAQWIGDWREEFQSAANWSYASEREALLNTLRSQPLEFA